MKIKLTVNGELREADVWAGESLLFTLREQLGLPGSKNACEQGECGSCSVYLDGTLVCSCLVLAAQAEALAQREQQALALPHLGLALLAVDDQLDPHAKHLSSARCARTRSA